MEEVIDINSGQWYCSIFEVTKMLKLRLMIIFHCRRWCREMRSPKLIRLERDGLQSKVVQITEIMMLSRHDQSIKKAELTIVVIVAWKGVD